MSRNLMTPSKVTSVIMMYWYGGNWDNVVCDQINIPCAVQWQCIYCDKFNFDILHLLMHRCYIDRLQILFIKTDFWGSDFLTSCNNGKNSFNKLHIIARFANRDHGSGTGGAQFCHEYFLGCISWYFDSL